MPKHAGHTSLGGGNILFPLTEWTRISDLKCREAVYKELYQKYWKPLYAFLRGKGFGNDKAKDLVQDFFTEKVLEQELIDKADRNRGKFRNLLLVAIRNYAINACKSEKSFQELSERTDAVSNKDDPDIEFNRVWADEILDKVLKELKTECSRKGKNTHWEIFREWLLEPALDGNKTLMSDICSKYSIEDTSAAYNMIANIKGRFRAILRSHLRPLVKSESDVDAEIDNFITIFSKNPTRF